MRFSKWHAHGNSYILIEGDRTGQPLTRAAVEHLCDPDRGIGSHGVLEIVARDHTEAEIVIWNPDGTQAEMSGNGTRIAAAWLAAETHKPAVSIVVSGRRIEARVIAPGLIEQTLGAVEVGEVEVIDILDTSVALITVDVGNPHAVVVDQPVTREALLAIGPAIEAHARFANRTNVQLARPDPPSGAHALVWERGAGETPSSGSSAVAVAAAAQAMGWCAGGVTVRMPGGELHVSIDGGIATLTGPVAEIARGETVGSFQERPS